MSKTVQNKKYILMLAALTVSYSVCIAINCSVVCGNNDAINEVM